MGTLITVVVCIALAVFSPLLIRQISSAINQELPNFTVKLARLGFGLLALWLVLSTSYVYVDKNEVGLINKIYGIGSLANGHIIATGQEPGPQAEIIQPGFHVMPLVNVLNKVVTDEITTVPDGQYGYLVAKDGAPLDSDQAFARPLSTFADKDGKKFTSFDMLDARTFLLNGGQKGPQTTVLPPGQYRLNTFLWTVTFKPVVEVPTGQVGVIRSNVHAAVEFGNLVTNKPTSCEPTQKTGLDGGELSVPLVPVGCIGIWDNSLLPGKYYFNQDAYTMALVDTRLQVWDYKGGYRKRYIDLKPQLDGKLDQTSREEDVVVPPGAAGEAIRVKIEGWDIPLELRILAQIPANKAPFVLSSVGDLAKVENSVITPLARSVVRNVLGSSINAPVTCPDGSPKCTAGDPLKDEKGNVLYHERPTRVLDLIESRAVLERNIEDILKVEGAKDGVVIKEVRLGEPVIPPELLLARLRSQLATQMMQTYIQEQSAQEQRVRTEQARATADQQPELVRAQIDVQRSQQEQEAARNRGLGEQARLEAIAKGQAAQANVLGQDRVMQLRMFELAMDFMKSHPDVVEKVVTNAQKFVPTITVGSDNGLAGAAAIFGHLMSQAPQPAAK